MHVHIIIANNTRTRFNIGQPSVNIQINYSSFIAAQTVEPRQPIWTEHVSAQTDRQRQCIDQCVAKYSGSIVDTIRSNSFSRSRFCDTVQSGKILCNRRHTWLTEIVPSSRLVPFMTLQMCIFTTRYVGSCPLNRAAVHSSCTRQMMKFDNCQRLYR